MRVLNWMRIALFVCFVVILALILFGRHLETKTLPGCDASRATDAVTELLRERGMQRRGFHSIRTVSESEAEIRCEAVFEQRNGAALDIAYRFFWNGDDQRAEVRWRERR